MSATRATALDSFLRFTLALLGSVALTLLLSVGLLSRYQRAAALPGRQPESAPSSLQYRLLDGQRVADGSPLDRRPFAAVIDNRVESRPPAGLEDASIVYEVIVEGDITRLLALFDADSQTEQIGPVRSLRPFFIDLAAEWDAVLFFAGGSPAALARVASGSFATVNEISGDGIYFWRDVSRFPPHNLYTSAALMSRAAAAKQATSSAEFIAWQFKDGTTTTSSAVLLTVPVSFSDNPLYRVEYRYNPETNDYTRYQNNKVHKTSQGIVLKAGNVVVQHVTYDVLDEVGRLAIDLDRGGAAEIYQDGRQVNGFWQKINGRTRFYDQADREISFNRGTVWVELVFD